LIRPGRAVPDTADLLVVGGGINGAGIARDAAGRGWSVVLCEQDDLASATSSASTKLIHGGLRYLEHLEFRLVREALSEREVLLAMAPHIIWPMRFVLPHHRGLRPARVLRFGLFLYDHLGGRERLPGARSLNLRRHPAGEPLRDEFTKGFEYSDCWVDDARLVVLNAMDARERGATVLTRTRLDGARRTPAGWEASLAGPDGGRHRLVCRSIVNATGPWVGETLHRLGVLEGAPGLRLVKGSHIVIPRHFGGDRAYCFQGADGRVVFAIPY
jgi:glycerol-3-phosphate dehydrogenase